MMHLARTARTFPFSRVAQGSVVTIGAFDGLHLGHQRLLDRVLKESAARGLPAVAMSFEPLPKEFFSAKTPPARLTSFREKFDALDGMGIDIFYCPNFNAAMRNITADDFIRQLLIHTLNARHLVVGDDFVFARNRQGTLAELRRASRALDFSVERVSSVIVEGQRVSSTAIRTALREGEIQRAERLLGKPYRMSGKVVSRKQDHYEGKVHFVTLGRRRSPVKGVFAVKVSVSGGQPIDAVACIGVTDADNTSVFAIRIMGVDEDLSGSHVHVDFIARVLDREKYPGVLSIIENLDRYAADASVIMSS